MKNAPLKTQQGSVSRPLVQKYVNMSQSGSQAPAIKVDKGIIVDGNHRYIAGRIVGIEPAQIAWAGGNPARIVPWDKVIISPLLW